MKFIKMPENRLKSIVQSSVFTALGLAVMLMGQSASAAKFGVKVVNEAGTPVVGASVCMGLPGNYKQFGAVFTDADGQAVLDVPNMPLVVTVSKTRFSGMRISEPARGFNLIKQVTLSEGIPGPRCRAGSTLVSNPSSIIINNVVISEGVYTTNLEPVVTGKPNYYRVSNSNDFEGVRWQSFNTAIALPSSLSDEPSVFLQLRRYEGSRKAWIEARSDVFTVLMPTQLLN